MDPGHMYLKGWQGFRGTKFFLFVAFPLSLPWLSKHGINRISFYSYRLKEPTGHNQVLTSIGHRLSDRLFTIGESTFDKNCPFQVHQKPINKKIPGDQTLLLEARSLELGLVIDFPKTFFGFLREEVAKDKISDTGVWDFSYVIASARRVSLWTLSL